MAICKNPCVYVEDEVIIAAGPPRRHRAFPTGVRLPDGDILVAFRVGSDHHMTHDGAIHLTRSTDNGRHWQPACPLAAWPEWDVCGAIGQYPDGVMPEDEPYLRAILMCYRWIADPSPQQDYRTYKTQWITSDDGGRNWRESHVLLDGLSTTINTDGGPMKVSGLAPHSYSSTIMRLSDRTLMGMFHGNKEIYKYKARTQGRKSQGKEVITEVPLAAFSRDEMKTWDFVRVADPDAYGIGFSEADIARLDTGRIVAVYGNNQGDRHFYRTYSDDEGRTWAPMKQLAFSGDSPSMVTLQDGSLLVAFRNIPDTVPQGMGIGLAISRDGGDDWQCLGNMKDQGGWDMGYPDLVALPDGRFLCIFYTDAEARLIPADQRDTLAQREPMRTIFPGPMRPRAYGELDGAIRGVFLRDISTNDGTSDTALTSDRDRVDKTML